MLIVKRTTILVIEKKETKQSYLRDTINTNRHDYQEKPKHA